jgi:threonyl-tRNA synthetase
MAVVGRRESEQRTVTLRRRGEAKEQETLGVDALVARLTKEIAERALTPGGDVSGA